MNMVQNRGIDISVISQFDIRRLPEFPHPLTQSDPGFNTVTCYVPIYSGSQIWFEYTVEPPHPPQAAYFFKLFVNGRSVVAWDCTEKHGYHGKMIYILERTDTYQEFPKQSVQRKGFKFRNHEDFGACGSHEDCLEIRVHRIEHRRRVYEELPGQDRGLDGCAGSQLEFINGGTLEVGRPQRRYKYQLLDPSDEPFAVFRFLYRSYEYLRQNNIVSTPSPSTSSSSLSSKEWHIAPSSPIAQTTQEQEQEQDLESNIRESTTAPKSDQPRTPPRTSPAKSFDILRTSPTLSHRLSTDTYLPPSDSDESLSVLARDSIEDLSSTIPRSPDSPRFKQCNPRSPNDRDSPKPAPLSPRQKLKKQFTHNLNINLTRASSTVDRPTRLLSPFTGSGLLRRAVTPDFARSAPSSSMPSESTSLGEGGSAPGLLRSPSKRSESGASQRTVLSQRSAISVIERLNRRVWKKD